VKRWMRSLAIYSPGIVMLVAGVVVLLTVPLVQVPSSQPCNCTPGPVCTCPVQLVSTWNFTGPILLTSAALYSFFAFLIRLERTARPRLSS
jgi:hypothetical protein